MTAIDFPVATVVGQKFTAGGVTYTWNGVGWITGVGVQPTDAYSKAESDARYEPLDNPYDKVESDGRFVNVTGDSMTGHLVLDNASIFMDKAVVSSPAATVVGRLGTVDRWHMSLGNLAAETGGNVGSHFVLARFSDTGDILSTPLVIYRNDGSAVFAHNLTGNALFSATSITAGSTIGAHGQIATDANFYTVAGRIDVSPNGAVYYDTATATMRMVNNATGFGLFVTQAGVIHAGCGLLSRQGQSGAVGSNNYNFFWNGVAALQGWVDATNMGNVAFTSDYRTKKDIEPLPSMWDTIKALKPIKYTQKAFSPPSHVALVAERGVDLFTADNTERWGFLAHELQETMVDSAASAPKDAPDAIQSPNPWTVIAALTRALQEAMTEIEALKAHTGMTKKGK